MIASKSSLVAIRLNHIVQECHWMHKIKPEPQLVSYLSIVSTV
jgi:hypothetical protein